jgi:hypothetical protein
LPIDHESLQLTLAAPLEEDTTLAPLVEPALHVGKALVLEGCYCRLGGARGPEIVKIGRLHPECEITLVEDMDARSGVMHVSPQQVHKTASMPTQRALQKSPDTDDSLVLQLALLDLAPGAALVIGREIVCVKKGRGPSQGLLVAIARGQCGTSTQMHPRGTKVKRLVSVSVRPSPHSPCRVLLCITAQCHSPQHTNLPPALPGVSGS